MSLDVPCDLYERALCWIMLHKVDESLLIIITIIVLLLECVIHEVAA